MGFGRRLRRLLELHSDCVLLCLDLLFFYSPISHVSIYLGNGMQVHAPNTGSTVSIAAVNWGKVTGVGRPG